ncbi:MAG: hypothetical protein WAX69_22915 [Victivallales bacterium]
MDYIKYLGKWIKASERFLYTPPERPDLECYGTGYDNWGVQTNQKAFAAFAVLAGCPDNELMKQGLSREYLLEHSLKLLRFSLESHVSGSFNCTDGKKWGNTWISALGIERMMHGVEAIEGHLNTDDRELLKNVLVSESEWLLKSHDIVASPIDKGSNRPESNLWNGALLHRTGMLYPDVPHAEEYREKGIRFMVNSISVPSDVNSDIRVDGKTVRDRFVGANFFESYALNHHGYLNVGYMVICLSNIAMLHFSYKRKNIRPPEALYHHAWDLWKLVKTCTFPDGRLLRIGGDTRVRYCYCQDYAIPMWLFINDHFGDADCLEFERQWFKTAVSEMRSNSDGSFLHGRLSRLEELSPLYYTRLESDRAVTFSMAAQWKDICGRKGAGKNQNNAPSLEQWHDEYHGACLTRSPKRIASWVWQGATTPLGGFCLPPGRSDMAEWADNLLGRITGTGEKNCSVVTSHGEHMFKGGFLTYGISEVRSEMQLSEGEAPKDKEAIQKSVFAALPDDTTVVGMHYAKTITRTFLRSVKGITLMMPNDIFNRKSRTYCTESGTLKLKGLPPKAEDLKVNSSWINIDGCLSVIGLYGADSMYVSRPGERQIGLRHKPFAGGMLYADEICYPCINQTSSFDAGQTIMDIAFIVQSGVSPKETAASAGSHYPISDERHPGLRAVMIAGADGLSYLLLANFGETDIAAGWSLKLNVFEKLTSLKDDKVIAKSSNGFTLNRIMANTAELYLCN